MPKHVGHPILNLIYNSLKKVKTKNDIILVKDFESKVFKLGWRRKHETLSWLVDLNKEIASFRNFSQSGMSIHKPFEDIFYRVRMAVRAINSALQDEFVKPSQLAVLNEVKEELEAYLLMLEFGEVSEEVI